jgi:hypothetical protein
VGITDVTVQLLDENGIVIAEVNTSSDGSYIFSSDPAGTDDVANGYDYNITQLEPNKAYTVRIPNVSGGSKQSVLGDNILTVSDNGTGANANIHDSDGIANDENATAAITATDIPLSGANNHSFDFGFTQPASLGDRVWYDDNANGIQDNGEGNVSGVRVYLLDSNGDRIQDVNGQDIFCDTNNSGEYLFEGLTPGTYSVEFDLNTLPDNYEVTISDRGGYALDSDANETTGKTSSVTLSPGEHNPRLDMGIHRVGATENTPYLIGTHFWIDGSNGGENDGIYQEGVETPIGGALVELLDENGNKLYWSDTAHSSLTTTQRQWPAEKITTADGVYGFDVPAGTYQVRFYIPQNLIDDEYAFVQQGNNTDNNINQNVADKNGFTQTVIVGPGYKVEDLTLDAAVHCTCADAPVKSNGGDALSMWGMSFMAFITLITGLFFVRKEEEQRV